jgi:Subtilase family
MPERSNLFPHIKFKLVNSATSKSGQPPRRSQQSDSNRGNRDGHGRSLNSSTTSIISDWQTNLGTRREEGLPDLPNAPSLLLKVDPKSFDADALKGFGIEVVLELEDGYILGASVDADLTQLQQKIAKFIAEERGGAKVAEIWEILEGRFGRLQYILSPDLLENWENVEENRLYTIDISIACVGLVSKFSDCPPQHKEETPEKFANRMARWLDRRDQTIRDWDELQEERESEFKKFVADCEGIFLQEPASDDRTHLNLLPDSFSCCIRISGKGLKDIALNYPYVFDISEPEQFTQIQVETESIVTESSFTLQPPLFTAPKVCVIDSGILEKHSYLRVAIDTANSRSWVPDEGTLTADSVRGGGHGTRVAGALLYPQGIPSTPSEQAACWIQNARVLDGRGLLPEKLYLPEILTDIVSIY